MKEFDIKIRTYSFSNELLAFTRLLEKTSENQILIKQIVRSGTSIGANVAESKGGVSKKDFSHYFSIALKSANETVYWLNLIKDNNPKVKSEALVLITELDEIIRVLATIVINCRKEVKS